MGKVAPILHIHITDEAVVGLEVHLRIRLELKVHGAIGMQVCSLCHINMIMPLRVNLNIAS